MPSLHDPRRTGERVTALLDGAAAVTIVAPFVTIGGLDPILDVLDDDAAITLYTRWRANEVAAGVSDPHVFDLVDERGGEVRLHYLLHAKVYLRAGMGALVGSSNATVPGLGWREGGGLELLIDADERDPGILALLDMLAATSPQATAKIRDQVLAQAATFGSATPLQSEPETPARDLTTWLPNYSMPRVLWRVYIGDREETVTRLASPDLAALDPPPDLDEEQFNAYVGSLLLQGLPGLVAQRLVNRTTFQAVNELARLAADLGIHLDDPEQAWKTLASWLAYFLPGQFTMAAGGKALYG